MLGACTPRKESLKVGIIKPSIDHLPLSFALNQGWLDAKLIETVHFSSGWEVQEALISGRIDMAIMPFTYVWNAVSRGYPLKTVSFFERETDAIVVQPEIRTAKDLDGKKIGLLKGSTLDVLWQDFASQNAITATPLYFRTPNEAVAALQKGEVSAVVLYVPIVNLLEKDFTVLHWFGDGYPHHPCCDLVVNENNVKHYKEKQLRQFLAGLSNALTKLDYSSESLGNFAKSNYGISAAQLSEGLKHTKFEMGLTERGKEFQLKMAHISLSSGYLDKIPEPEEVFWDIERY